MKQTVKNEGPRFIRLYAENGVHAQAYSIGSKFCAIVTVGGRLVARKEDFTTVQEADAYIQRRLRRYAIKGLTRLDLRATAAECMRLASCTDEDIEEICNRVAPINGHSASTVFATCMKWAGVKAVTL